MKNLAVILENIDRLLVVKKMSQNKASDLAGHHDAIRNIRRKVNGKGKGSDVTTETLEDIARVLGTTSAELRKTPAAIDVQPVPGLRDSILKKIEWLDKERAQAELELAALDRAEAAATPIKKRRRR